MPETEKYVLITGAGRGLGKALALTFLEKGWRVLATDLVQPIYEDAGKPGLQALRQGSVKNLICLKMDVTSDESVAAAYALVNSENIRLDLVINNAGMDNYFLLSQAPVGKFKQMFEVNVFGAYRVNQVFLPLLRRPGGRIIHIGSESLNLAMPFMAACCSLK